MGNIVLRNVNKSFGNTTVIPDIDLDIEDGEFAVLEEGRDGAEQRRIGTGPDLQAGGLLPALGRARRARAPAAIDANALTGPLCWPRSSRLAARPVSVCETA